MSEVEGYVLESQGAYYKHGDDGRTVWVQYKEDATVISNILLAAGLCDGLNSKIQHPNDVVRVVPLMTKRAGFKK